MDRYDTYFQPTLSAIQRAQDSRNTRQFSGSSGAPGTFPSSRQVERDVNYDATRDPRVRDRAKDLIMTFFFDE